MNDWTGRQIPNDTIFREALETGRDRLVAANRRNELRGQDVTILAISPDLAAAEHPATCMSDVDPDQLDPAIKQIADAVLQGREAPYEAYKLLEAVAYELSLDSSWSASTWDTRHSPTRS